MTTKIQNYNIQGSGVTGQVLTANSTGGTEWVVGGSGSATPGGSNTQLQFNNSGAFGGTAGLTFSSANTTLSTGNVIATGTLSANVVSANGSVGTAGQVLTSNGTTTYWSTASGAAAFTSFTTNGTWTKPTSGTFAKVTVIGPGGGGATAVATSQAGGGLGGDIVTAIIPLASLGATETVSIGTPGAGAAGASANGVNGIAASFGTHVIAAGGAGGATGSLGNITYTGTASSVATGDAQLSSTGIMFTAYGADKTASASAADQGISNVIGKGGSSSHNAAGAAGTGFGAGGGAGVTAGGAGAPGKIIVEVF